MKHLVLVALSTSLLFACSKKEDEAKKGSTAQQGGSPDWGDDPRPLGSCVGVSKPGVEVPGGGKAEVCLENQTEEECTRPSDKMDYSYGYHTTCASRGYSKKCEGGDFPDSARFKECPAAAPSPNLETAKEVIGIFDNALAIAAEAKSDCKVLGDKLDGIRTRLWDIGKEHPNLFKSLSDAELKSIKAADTVDRLTNALEACLKAKNAHTMEFAFAMTKVI